MRRPSRSHAEAPGRVPRTRPLVGRAAPGAASSPAARTPPHPVIDVHDITKVFDLGQIHVRALRNVSLRIDTGDLVAIMGSSGSGKTTLLRLIGGVIRPQSGTILFDGEPVDPSDIDKLFALRRRLGMLFQFGALFTDLSVFENVAFPLREHTDLPDSMIRDIVLLKLNAVGLRGAASLRISEVSGGMARRIALARAIALDPELIMYDEPFAGLDPISLGITANLIRRLNDATGATSIIVSHDVDECFQICDYSYLISSGRIVGHGTAAQLNASEDPEVRQFIRGEPDGPVPFHYPAKPIEQELGLPG
jgi:phospholipid/cholesterol/gamma-HCH transport system ATP-binding protein